MIGQRWSSKFRSRISDAISNSTEGPSLRMDNLRTAYTQKKNDLDTSIVMSDYSVHLHS